MEEILVDGLDDWTYESWVTGVVAARGVEDSEVLRAATIGLIAQSIVGGLKVPGDVTPEGHVPWGCTAAEAVERVARVWLEEWNGDEWPHFGDIVWLANTAAGDAVAHAALTREG